MKRFFFTLVLLSVALTASAQKFGVSGGMSLSRLEDVEDSGMAGFNLGVAYNIPLALGFALQPELNYNVKGAKLADDVKYSAGYCELGLQAQWGVDLIVAKPFILFEPYIGGGLNNNLNYSDKSLKKNNWDFAKQLECGFAFGGGVEILYNLQISAKHFWAAGKLFKSDGSLNKELGDLYHDRISDVFDGDANFAGTVISLTYFF